MKPHNETLKRLRIAAGFVFLRGGWVRKEVAPKLQDKIDKAVKDAVQDVERIKGDGANN